MTVGGLLRPQQLKAVTTDRIYSDRVRFIPFPGQARQCLDFSREPARSPAGDPDVARRFQAPKPTACGGWLLQTIPMPEAGMQSVNHYGRSPDRILHPKQSMKGALTARMGMLLNNLTVHGA